LTLLALGTFWLASRDALTRRLEETRQRWDQLI
jgi:hypothetical protein